MTIDTLNQALELKNQIDILESLQDVFPTERGSNFSDIRITATELRNDVAFAGALNNLIKDCLDIRKKALAAL